MTESDSDFLDYFASKQEYSSSPRTNVANDFSIYYKGLFGMILCILPGAIVGLVLVKLSLDQASEARNAIENHPQSYKDSSIKRVKNGTMMARIGLGLFIVEIIALVLFMSAN